MTEENGAKSAEGTKKGNGSSPTLFKELVENMRDIGARNLS